jgi:large-conductance mechanosensitive channel
MHAWDKQTPIHTDVHSCMRARTNTHTHTHTHTHTQRNEKKKTFNLDMFVQACLNTLVIAKYLYVIVSVFIIIYTNSVYINVL